MRQVGTSHIEVGVQKAPAAQDSIQYAKVPVTQISASQPP